MQKFTKITSLAVPWLMPNVDTDIITPIKRMLSAPTRLERYAFEPYRFVGGNADTGDPDPDFPLNKPCYRAASILIVGENFGGGSSRETAPKAIAKMGFRCLIGSSIGGIFFKNCFQVGLLPISLPKAMIERLAAEAEYLGEFTVDLERQTIAAPSGERIAFEVETINRAMLLAGLDTVGMTLKKKDKIMDFFARDRKRRPWLYTK
jgi:3-isopropylmalate/(R)-2-methylmalate dehydratase small subunit